MPDPIVGGTVRRASNTPTTVLADRFNPNPNFNSNPGSNPNSNPIA